VPDRAQTTEPTPIPTAPCPTAVDWPHNEGSVADVGMELWWIASRVRAGDRNFGAHLVVFRVGPETVLAGAVLTDTDTGEEFADRRSFTRSDVTLAEGRLEVVTPAGSFRGSFEEGYRVTVEIDEETGFELETKPPNPVLFNCGTGAFPMSGSTTYQYSIGGMTATGSVRLKGETLEVAGAGWYDRQWTAGAASPENANFTWFGIWLDNGDTISLWDRTVADPDERSWATVVHADGTHVIAAVEPVAGGASGSVETTLGHEVPSAWKIEIPGVDTTLEMTHKALQDDPSMPFFTGVLDVHGTCRGAAVRGGGFSDLVGWWAS
jgi:predicted secreted hydrolase